MSLCLHQVAGTKFRRSHTKRWFKKQLNRKRRRIQWLDDRRSCGGGRVRDLTVGYF